MLKSVSGGIHAVYKIGVILDERKGYVMRTKEIRYYLHTLDDLRQDISKLKEDIRTYKNMDITTIKINIITDMPRGSAGVASVVETIALDRCIQIERMEQKLAHNILILQSIDSVIGGLKGSVKDIIQLRYFDKQIGRPDNTMYYISRKMGCSIDYIKKIDTCVVYNIQKRYIENITQKKAPV